MKRILLCLLLLLLTTGCTAEYNLTIDDLENFTYEETGYIRTSNLEEISTIYDSEWPTVAYTDSDYDSEAPTKFPDEEYYEVESSKIGEIYQVKYHYTFLSNRFNDSVGVKTGFYDFKKTKNTEENTTTLDTGKFYYEKFPDLEKLTINLTVNNPVVSHNADEVNGNVYTWVLTPENFSTARLILTYQNNATTEDTDQTRFIIVTILFLGFMIFIIVASFLNKKKNSQK